VDLCSAEHQVLGHVVESGGKHTLTDAAGATQLTITRDGPDDLHADGPQGQKLRVHGDKGETRVLRPDGVAFGSIGLREGSASLFDAASVPLATITPRDKGQLVAALDGAPIHYVTPCDKPTLAGLFAIDALTLHERAALARALAR
jgi:hypothetical protein